MRRPLLRRLLVVLVGAWLPFALGHGGHTPPGGGENADATSPAVAQQSAPSGHEASEGVLLGASSMPDGHDGETEPVRSCPAEAPIRHYDVVAAKVEITLNRFLDFDPQGRAYVLSSELQRVREEEARNRAARAGGGEPAVTPGLQGDALQPLVLRVNQGECLRVDLTNGLEDDAPVSFHVHGAALTLWDDGVPALAREPSAAAGPGETVRYAWWVEPDEPEGTHYVHSHGDPRAQTGHGLFGSVVVEPAGSVHLDPRTGSEGTTGWDAIIRTPDGSDFREFVLVYHEIGNERYRHMDRDGRLVELVDPFTRAYKPGGRAINYRSEPFLNRMRLQHERTGRIDESLAYSSYAFGDPATPVARSYLGDPVKQRLVHGGSEVFHVHHVHGGSTRWPRQPGSQQGRFDTGLDKRPPLLPEASERIDSQSIGPSESFDVEHECGSGGCQQGAGDYLIHCHVAHHYFAGMWMIWRVYNTLQTDSDRQDALPPLQELPDRRGDRLRAVTSSELLGRTFERGKEQVTLDETSLAAWVEPQLPPPGEPRGYDASVLDWRREGTLYLGEPGDGAAWANHAPERPGEREPIRFDPRSGRLAYPFLQPHLAKRPPFPPDRNPAPFLDPFGATAEAPPAPGANGEASVCPAGSEPVRFDLHAVEVPLTLNARLGIVDPVGQLFVLREEEGRVRADADHRVPLALRARAGEECLDLTLVSELSDSRRNALNSKVGVHVHFVQFDVQASDGVTIGFNYEQTVRPFAVEGETLIADASAGEATLRATGDRFQPGVLVGIGMDQGERFEVRRVQAVRGDLLELDLPLGFDHAAGEIVSSEFVRYRWFPDVQFGTAYFHDHVAALDSWKHGLFGALVAEPPDARFLHPHTGEALRSGPLADVHTDAAVSADVTGSFRELVLFLQDDNPLTRIGGSSGSSLNLRVEPLEDRAKDPAALLASDAHGDPETPIVEAYAGDPVVLRGLVSATNDLHTLHVDGHSFRREPFSGASSRTSTARLGISERFDAYIPSAGGPLQTPADYLIRNGRDFKFREGSWALLRVHDPRAEVALRSLPRDAADPPSGDPPSCPLEAPQAHFELAAVEAPLPMLEGAAGRVFALERDVAALISGRREPEPLVLYVREGDCLIVDLHNRLPNGAVSFHADLPAADPPDRRALAVGRNGGRVVGPGERGRYRYYAHPERGTHVARVQDGADALANVAWGLYGAVVVVPAGAAVSHPETGDDLLAGSGWRADVHPPGGPSHRSFTLFLQEEDPIIGTAIMPYTEQVAGVVGLNYRRTRLDHGSDRSVGAFDSSRGEPSTPHMQAHAGDPLQLHVLVPFAEQGHVFSVEGHEWPMEPAMAGSTLLAATQIGALEALTLEVTAGAPGAYLYGDHREPYREAGLWGLLRVHRPGAADAGLRPLPARPP